MQKKIFTTFLLSVVLIIFGLSAATEGLAQSSPPEDCSITITPKKGDPFDITIAPVKRNGQFPFLSTSTDLEYPCSNGAASCVVAPYSITGGKLNELWITYQVDPAKFEIIGVGGSSGYTIYPPCEENYLTSCLASSIRVTFQTNSPDTQKFQLYLAIKNGAQDAYLGDIRFGTGDFAGGYGSDTLLCPGGIITPSTEETCVAEKFDGIARQDIDSFENVLVRISRDKNGCATLIDVCTSPDPDNINQCLVAWVPATEATAPTFNGLEITDCGKTRGPAGINVPCKKECKIISAVNPGWITYKIAGTWYKVCGGYIDSRGYCCDPDTGICTPY